MTLLNARGSMVTDPIRNFRFLVSFKQHRQASQGWSPEARLGFTSISGLAVSTESIPYREGGFNSTVHQVPGQSNFSPVTFQRGVTIGSRQHWDWMRMLFRTVNGNGETFGFNTPFRADVEIAVLNHPVPYSNGGTAYVVGEREGERSKDDLVVARFRLFNAWPTSVAYSDLSAGDNALMVEQLTLVHEGFDMKWAKASDGDLTTADEF